MLFVIQDSFENVTMAAFSVMTLWSSAAPAAFLFILKLLTFQNTVGAQFLHALYVPPITSALLKII